MKCKIGDRVGALLSTDRDARVVELLGYGVYEGAEVPPDSVGGFNIGLSNPKLRLDSGKVVWGCECWWGPELQVSRNVKGLVDDGWTVRDVDIDDVRGAKE
jgi:hypothetical protein